MNQVGQTLSPDGQPSTQDSRGVDQLPGRLGEWEAEGRTDDEVDVRLAAAHGRDDDVEQVDALAVHQPAEGDDGHAPIDAAAGARQVRLKRACIHRCTGKASLCVGEECTHLQILFVPIDKVAKLCKSSVLRSGQA